MGTRRQFLGIRTEPSGLLLRRAPHLATFPADASQVLGDVFGYLRHSTTPLPSFGELAAHCHKLGA